MCAKESEGSGVCFDGAKYACNATDPRPVRCYSTAGCGVGTVCVKEWCACNGTGMGICVSSEGCGRRGVDVVGELVYKGTGRSVKLF